MFRAPPSPVSSDASNGSDTSTRASTSSAEWGSGSSFCSAATATSEEDEAPQRAAATSSGLPHHAGVVRSPSKPLRAARFADPAQPIEKDSFTPSPTGISTSPPPSPTSSLRAGVRTMATGEVRSRVTESFIRHQQSVLLRKLTPEVVRLVCNYIPLPGILLGIVRVCKALHAALGAGSQPHMIQTARHFWLERWRESYGLSTKASLTTRAVLVRPYHQDIVADMDRLVCSPLASPPTLLQHQLVSNVEDLQRAIYFLDTRRRATVMPPMERIRAIRISDTTNDEPHPRDELAEEQIAIDVACGLSCCFLNGYHTTRERGMESEQAFRASVVQGSATATRDGFGVVLPLYEAVEDLAGDSAKATILTHDCCALGYSSPPSVKLQASTLPVKPLYAYQDMEQYWWMLEHVHMSDVKHYAWSEETKYAACATIVSPVGRAAQVRLYIGALFGGFPRFYAKCVMTPAQLPREDIVDNFSDGDELFAGGYGRVEVDVAPRVRRAHFEQLRDELGLRPSFPLTLLWNLVCGSTGAVKPLAPHNGSFLALYAHNTFADEAARQLAQQ